MEIEQRIKSEYDRDVLEIMGEYTQAIANLRDYGRNMSHEQIEQAQENLRIYKDAKIKALVPDTPFKPFGFSIK